MLQIAANWSPAAVAKGRLETVLPFTEIDEMLDLYSQVRNRGGHQLLFAAVYFTKRNS